MLEIEERHGQGRVAARAYGSDLHNVMQSSTTLIGLSLWKRYTRAMSVQIQQSELRNDNAAVMRRVAEGESFVVTVNGRPVADVVPHQRDSGRHRFVPVGDLAEALAATRAPNPTQWLTDLSAADGVFGSDKPTDPFTEATI